MKLTDVSYSFGYIEQNSTVRSFIICICHQILLRGSSQGGQDRQDMKNAGRDKFTKNYRWKNRNRDLGRPKNWREYITYTGPVFRSSNHCLLQIMIFGYQTQLGSKAQMAWRNILPPSSVHPYTEIYSTILQNTVIWFTTDLKQQGYESAHLIQLDQDKVQCHILVKTLGSFKLHSSLNDWVDI